MFRNGQGNQPFDKVDYRLRPVALLLEREWRAEWEGMDTNEGINRLENLFCVSGKSASSAD